MMRHASHSRFLAILCVLAHAAPVLGEAHPEKPRPVPPQVAEASRDGERAITGFAIPTTMQVELFAAEPLLANPASFCIDARGRFFVAETFRQEKGVEDNRSHMSWLDDDLAAQTVDDRLAMYRRHLGDRVEDYQLEDDRIRLIEDTDGDGRADRSTVFADGFNGILEGTGAGVLAREGDVYYANIPNLWRLSDADDDGRADVRESLHSGFGVRVAFRGHDLHGPTIGPDGRLYFSVGDRGFNVTTQEGRHLARPDTGAVFRCEPDGSDLEVYAYGLRNPQELAFDDYGNLFTGDNNSDSGDRARWVYVVKGGDSGWRMYYQYLEDRGPWNRERMWHPYRSDPETAEKQPAFIVPPVANLADGPAGLVYYPGVGFPERYRGHFFLADFRGDNGRSGIRSFAVREKGATFELVDSHQLIWRVLATDVDFGYDGSLYLTDWVNGWVGPGKGRLYRFWFPDGAQEAAQSGSAQLMREGFTHRPVRELADLLEHPDRRIRLEAQFALVERQAADTLATIAVEGESQLARIHAIWGIGQLTRANADHVGRIQELFRDDDPEIRAQAARVCAENLRAADERGETTTSSEVIDDLAALLADANPRVRFFGAMAMGQVGRPQELPRLLALLAQDRDRDPLLRHAGVMGLAGIGRRHPDSLLAQVRNSSASARMGVLLALRRLHRPEISTFLDDPEPALVLEAARAIHDEPIAEAMPKLAGLALEPARPDSLLRRLINANFRVGAEENARALVAIAGNEEADESHRLQALQLLGQWGRPPPKDAVLGAWRPLEQRSADFIPRLLEPLLADLLQGSEPLRRASIQVATQYHLIDIGPTLRAMLGDFENSPSLRVDSLRALDRLRAGDLLETAEATVRNDPDPRVRSEGRRVLAELVPETASALLAAALESGETLEKQDALQVLATMKTPAADQVLSDWLTKLVAGDVPLEVQLDLLEAVRSRGTAALTDQLDQFEATRSHDDPLAGFRECLAGGDSERGRQIFFGRAEASCRRCHVVNGEGAAIGPDLTRIGGEKTREYLLEALVAPDRQIAKGFETAVVVTNAGRVYSGIVKEERDAHLLLLTAGGEEIIVEKSEIDERSTGVSAMPADLVKPLSKPEVRDLVEYLASLKGPTGD